MCTRTIVALLAVLLERTRVGMRARKKACVDGVKVVEDAVRIHIQIYSKQAV